MKLTDMLAFYRGKALAPMQDIAAEFKALSPADQRELLFWMIIDTNSNQQANQHVRPGSTVAGTA